MKKSTSFYLILFLFLGLSSFAQEVNLTWGEEILNPNKATPSKILFKLNNEVLVYSNAKGKKEFFEVYDEQKGKLKSSKEFEFKRGKEEYFIESFNLVEGKILLVATIRDKEKFSIFTNYCDTKGKLAGKWNDIDVVKRDKNRDKHAIKFFYIAESKKLFAFKSDYSKKYDNETFTLISYDEKFEQIFKKKISIPYPAGAFDLVSLKVDQNERAYIFGNVDRKKEDKLNQKSAKEKSKAGGNKSGSKKKSKSEDEDEEVVEDDSEEVAIESDDDDEDGKKKSKSKSGSKEKKVKVQRIIPTLLTFDLVKADSVSAREFKIDLKEKFVYSMAYKVLPNEQLLIVGFYSNDYKSNGAHGVFSGKFDLSTKEKPVIKTEKFDTKYLQRLCGSEKERVTKFGAQYLNIHDISFFDDGSYMVTGDDYHSYLSCTYTSSGQQRCTRYYYANDILAIKFSANNEVEFFSYIPRKQFVAVPEMSFQIGFVSLTPKFAQPDNASKYMRHSMLKKGDKLYFVYNDNPKNLDSPKKSKKSKKPTPAHKNTEAPFNLSKSGIAPVLVTLDKDGNFEKVSLPGPGGKIQSKKAAKASKSSSSKKSTADKDKDKANKKYRFIPGNTYSISEEEMISFSMNASGKSYRLVNFKVTE